MKFIEEYKTGFSLQMPETNADFIRHEKLLYRGFYENNSWYARMCFNNIEDRLIPKIPYEDQDIFFLINNDEIVSGFSFSTNYKQKFEIEMMGYKLHKDNTVGQGLHYYSDLDNKYNKLELISNGLKASKYIDKFVRDKGIKVLYGNSIEEYVGAYKLIGFKKIDQLVYENCDVAILIKTY